MRTWRRRLTLCGAQPAPAELIKGSACAGLLGDFITADHISPRGAASPGFSGVITWRNATSFRPDFGARRGNPESYDARTIASNVKLFNKWRKVKGLIVRSLQLPAFRQLDEQLRVGS